MEGIRGFAVFLVFVVHYVTLVQPWISTDSVTYTIAAQMRSIGNIGVDLFFVLSGYLIYGMLIKKDKPFGAYLFRRIQRIYPTFTSVFLVYLVLSAIFPSDSKIPSGWYGAVFVLQNFLLLPGLFDVRPIITVAWSLSYEFFYYLLIPLLIAALKLRVWQPRDRIVFFVVLSVVAFGYSAAYGGGHIRLLMFVSGIILYEVSSGRATTKLPPIGLPALVVAIVGVIVMNETDFVGWWKFLSLYVLFFLFCLDCFVSPGLASRMFSFTPMRWLGNMSYSYYLIHGLALKFVFLLFEKIYPAQQSNVMLFWWLLPLAFALTLIPSTLLFIWVEKPYSLVPRAMPVDARRNLAN